MSARVEIPRGAVVDFCRRHHIRRMALFGLVLRDDLTSGSDIDVLVEFEPGRAVGFGFFDIQDDLSKILGRPVDMNTFKSIERSRNWLLRREILDSAEVIVGEGA